MGEKLNKAVSAITLRPGEVLPPGADILSQGPNGSKAVRRPIKYQPERNKAGLITGWKRRPRTDFI